MYSNEAVIASRFDCLIAIGSWPEHLVEGVSEPALEDIDVFGHHRQIVRNRTAPWLWFGQFAVVVEIDPGRAVRGK